MEFQVQLLCSYLGYRMFLLLKASVALADDGFHRSTSIFFFHRIYWKFCYFFSNMHMLS